MKIVTGIHQKDRAGIKALLQSTRFFNDEEVNVALELVDEKIKLGDKSSYQFLVALNDEEVPVGYSCYGKIPGTKSSFDLYWIAVNDAVRHQGIGHLLLEETGHQVKSQGGINLYAETSGRAQYKPTHQFYENENFILEAKLKDYFDSGDDKLLFTKFLT